MVPSSAHKPASDAPELERAIKLLGQADELAKGLGDGEQELAQAEICKAYASIGLCDEALRLALDISPGNARWQALTISGKAFVQCGKIEKGLQEVEKLEMEDDQSCLLDGIARALAEKGEVEEALKVAGNIVSDQRRVVSLAAVAEALALAGFIPEAVETVKQFEDSDKESRVLSSAIINLSRLGKVDDALVLLSSIEEEGWRPEALGEICAALIRKGRFPQAQAFYRELRKEDYKVVVLAPLSAALVEIGRTDFALGLIQDIKSRYAQAILISKVVGALVEKMEITEALEVAKDIDSSVPLDAHIELARGFAQAGDLEQALSIASKLPAKGSRIAALSEIIKVLINDKRFDEALEIVALMKRKKAQTLEQVKIAEAMAASDQVDSALELSDSIEESLYRVNGLTRIAVAITGHSFVEYI